MRGLDVSLCDSTSKQVQQQINQSMQRIFNSFTQESEERFEKDKLVYLFITCNELFVNIVSVSVLWSGTDFIN